LSAGKGPIFPNSDDEKLKEDKEEGIDGIDKDEVEGIDIDELEGIEKSKPSISV
jgi:hypothetical protein